MLLKERTGQIDTIFGGYHYWWSLCPMYAMMLFISIQMEEMGRNSYSYIT